MDQIYLDVVFVLNNLMPYLIANLSLDYDVNIYHIEIKNNLAIQDCLNQIYYIIYE